MSAYPSVEDLPACPRCTGRQWVRTALHYACQACSYSTTIRDAIRGTLAPPSRPIGESDVQHDVITKNVNWDDDPPYHTPHAEPATDAPAD